MKNLHILEHPLILHKLSIMRDENTSSELFRNMLCDISALACYELTRELSLEKYEIATPLTRTQGYKIADKVSIIPILRAGLGMIDGLVKLIPNARVGHIGLYRDHETHLPVEYYCKLPSDIENSVVIVVDPMLATGGSASDAITMLKARGCKNIKFLSLVSAPEGIERLSSDHSDVEIYTCAIDEKLNENAYIVPGLGDAGDRIFGTN